MDVDASAIKVYDSVTGKDVTDKFDISLANGVITANLKDGFTKSLDDAENTQVIDTTKFEFGRYYKFDIPATVKKDIKASVDIENTATQVVNYYNPTTKKVEKPNVPTEKRVNSVPVSVEFNFTKRLKAVNLKRTNSHFVLKVLQVKKSKLLRTMPKVTLSSKLLSTRKARRYLQYTVEEERY